MLNPTPEFPIKWVCRTLPDSVPAITEMLPDQSYLIVVNETLTETDRAFALKEQIKMINSKTLYKNDIVVTDGI